MVGRIRRTDYTSNIRGWQTDGKTVYKQTVSGSDLPFYAYRLAYANGSSYTNGNISSMLSSGKDQTAMTKGLSFTYDGASRLLASAGLDNYADTETGMTYDLSGNIKTLNRGGASVDNLSYNYSGNQLSSLNDGSGNNRGVKGGASSYGYDANGNMLTDGNRSATLTYNYLNLPKTAAVAGKTLTYDYDASGSKHKYIADTLTVKYEGGFEYNGLNVFSRLGLAEGQAVFKNNAITFQYYLKDHLGNVRVVLNDKGEILQKNDYYSFGLEIDRNNPVQTLAAKNGINRYGFQGQEKQVGSDYVQFKWRLHDPLTGRFLSIDPLNEKFEYNSTYAFSENKVTGHIELEGLETISAFVYSSIVEQSTATKQERRDAQASLIKNLVSLTDVNDATVLSTWAKRGGDNAINLDGSKASNWDKGFAVGGALLPVISGSALKKGVKAVSEITNEIIDIFIDAKRHPESAKHLNEAIQAGVSNEGVIDRAGARSRRRENLKSTTTQQGLDRDEAPPAVINTGKPSSVKSIPSSDNRGAGASIGNQLKGIPNGTRVRINTKNE